jgi:hypothetical protein
MLVPAWNDDELAVYLVDFAICGVIAFVASVLASVAIKRLQQHRSS